MYSYLKGILTHKGELLGGGHTLIVEVAGVGYQVLTSGRAWLEAPAAPAEVTVYTSLVVREDAMQLVGFFTREERELFEILTSASGVGAKVAFALLGCLSVPQLASAIVSSDVPTLTAAKGVGPKLAQKMALELKEKLTKFRDERLSALPKGDARRDMPTMTGAFQDAEAVLLSLGYDLQEIRGGVKAVVDTYPQSVAFSAEEALQHILKWLATHPVG